MQRPEHCKSITSMPLQAAGEWGQVQTTCGAFFLWHPVSSVSPQVNCHFPVPGGSWAREEWRQGWWFQWEMTGNDQAAAGSSMEKVFWVTAALIREAPAQMDLNTMAEIVGWRSSSFPLSRGMSWWHKRQECSPEETCPAKFLLPSLGRENCFTPGSVIKEGAQQEVHPRSWELHALGAGHLPSLPRAFPSITPLCPLRRNSLRTLSRSPAGTWPDWFCTWAELTFTLSSQGSCFYRFQETFLLQVAARK